MSLMYLPVEIFGLIWYKDDDVIALPLESVSSSVSVRGFIAHLSATLTYRNSDQSAAQAVFRCPVDEGSAIYSLQAKIEDRVIVASCMEKKKAEKLYETAIAEGRSAVLMREESQTADVISIELGNIAANAVTEITISQVTELQVSGDGGVQYLLPTVLNPRYCPADNPGQDADVPYEGGRLVKVTQPYTMDVSATITGSQKISRIVSHSDPISVSLEDGDTQAKITQNGGYRNDHDWSFVVYYNNPYEPQVLLETGDPTATGIMKDQVLMINLFPELPQQSYSFRNEVIFVIDRSGSMRGENIQSARAVLLLLLKSLPPGCLFNVISFGSQFKLLFPKGSQEYCKSSLAKAVSLHNEMDADMGGTEILQPLKSIYSQLADNNYARQVLLLTDGEVFNVDAVCDLIQRNAGNTRVFTVGIGEGASTSLVKGAARAGRGRSEMVTQRDRMQSKVMGLVASMLQNSVKNLQLNWEVDAGTRVSLVPPTPPTVFAGQHFTAYARLPPNSVLKGLHMTAEVEGALIKADLVAAQMKTLHDSQYSIHRLAARAMIRDTQADDTDESRSSVVELSTNTGVLSRYTALVLVDQDGKVIPTEKKQQMPVHTSYMTARAFCSPPMAMNVYCSSPMAGNVSRYAPDTSFVRHCGYYGNSMERSADSCDLATGNSIQESRSFGFGGHAGKLAGSISTKMKSGFRSLAAPRNKRSCSSKSSTESFDETDAGTLEETESSCTDGLLIIVAKQKFDGSWTIQDIADIFKITVSNVIQHKPKDWDKDDDTVLATGVALSLLEQHFGPCKVEWGLLAMKASAFIKAALGSTSGGKNEKYVTEAATALLAALKGHYPNAISF